MNSAMCVAPLMSSLVCASASEGSAAALVAIAERTPLAPIARIARSVTAFTSATLMPSSAINPW